MKCERIEHCIVSLFVYLRLIPLVRQKNNGRCPVTKEYRAGILLLTLKIKRTDSLACWSKSVAGRRKWIQIRRRRWWWRRQRRCKLCTVGVVGVQSIERNEDLLRRCRRRPRRLTEMTPQFHLRPISGFGASSRFAPSNVHSNKHAHHGRPGFCGLCFTTVLSLSSLLYMHLSRSLPLSHSIAIYLAALCVCNSPNTIYNYEQDRVFYSFILFKT